MHAVSFPPEEETAPGIPTKPKCPVCNGMRFVVVPRGRDPWTGSERAAAMACTACEGTGLAAPPEGALQ